MSHPFPPPANPEPAPASEGAPQPYSPAGQPFGGAGAPQPASKLKKIAGVAVPVAVAAVVGASWLGIGGPGEPEMGDCVQTQGDSEFEVVDCADAEAQYKVVGVEKDTYTEAEFDADDTLCSGFATTEVVLWSGDIGAEGTVLCAEPV
jgi:hypothetical protein